MVTIVWLDRIGRGVGGGFFILICALYVAFSSKYE